MSTVRTDVKAALNGHVPPTARVGAPLPTRQKRPGYAALATVLIVGLALVGAFFYSQAGKKVPVVVVVADVPAGHTIQRSDVSTVRVAGDITAIAGAHLNSVLGQTAVVELLPNTLLQRSMVTSTPSLTTTDAQVGVAVTSGQIPSDGLNPGDTVEILQLPAKDVASSGVSTPAPTVLTSSATVFSSSSDPSQSGGTLLTLVVPRSVAPTVAAASNAGLIALIRVGR